MSKVKPKLKPINPHEKFYHLYKYDVSYYSLFDGGDDGVPIIVGSYNLVFSTITHLSSDVSVFFYEKNSDGAWEEKETKRITPAKTQKIKNGMK